MAASLKRDNDAPVSSTPEAPAKAPGRKRFKTVGTGGSPPSRALPADQPAGVVLIFRPGRYEVYGDEVLPALVESPLENGLNGVRQLRGGAWDLSGLRENEENGGGFVCPLEWDYVFPGEGAPNRLGVTPCETVWSSPATYHALVSDWTKRDDRLGKFARPTVDDLEKLVERKTRELELMAVQQKNPENWGASELARQLDVARRALQAAT